MHQGSGGTQALLTRHRQVATCAAEDLGPFNGAKAPRYFLLHFEHVNVLLTLAVGKRYLWIVEKAQHIRFVCDQPLQQVAGLRAFEPSTLALALAFIQWRTRFFRFRQTVPVRIASPLHLVWWQTATGVNDAVGHGAQQGLYPLRSGLLILPQARWRARKWCSLQRVCKHEQR